MHSVFTIYLGHNIRCQARNLENKPRPGNTSPLLIRTDTPFFAVNPIVTGSFPLLSCIPSTKKKERKEKKYTLIAHLWAWWKSFCLPNFHTIYVYWNVVHINCSNACCIFDRSYHLETCWPNISWEKGHVRATGCFQFGFKHSLRKKDPTPSDLYLPL